MKPVTSFAIVLASSVFAFEDDILPTKRDAATIKQVIDQSTQALQKLDATVKSFDGTDTTQLVKDIASAKDVFVQGTKQILATDNITATDAVNLQTSLAPTQQAGNSLIADLESKKPVIEQNGLCKKAQNMTLELGTAASGLINATITKIPDNLQKVAQTLTAQFSQSLDDVSNTFSASNCTDAKSSVDGGTTSPAPGTDVATGNGTESSSDCTKNATTTASNKTSPLKSGNNTVTKSSAPVQAVAAASSLLVAGAASLLFLL